MPTFNVGLFVLGCAGGLLPDALKMIRNRYNPDLPNYLKTLNFWVGLVLAVAVGGLAAWILSAQGAKDALAYGYAAPQLLVSTIGSIVKSPPDRDTVLEPLNLRTWLSS